MSKSGATTPVMLAEFSRVADIVKAYSENGLRRACLVEYATGTCALNACTVVMSLAEAIEIDEDLGALEFDLQPSCSNADCATVNDEILKDQIVDQAANLAVTRLDIETTIYPR